MKTAEIIKLINDYWRFDINQVPRSTWHEKQDLIEIIQKSESVSDEKDRRIRELEKEVETLRKVHILNPGGDKF